MFRIRVERLLNKPIDEVFDCLADHGRYDRFPGVDKSELLEEGENEKNGLHALRRVMLGGMTLDERIVAFDRPYRLYYRIEQSRPLPFKHDFGEIDLVAEGDQTRVIWRSEGHINVPVIGSLVFDKIINKQGASGFEKTLSWIELQA